MIATELKLNVTKQPYLYFAVMGALTLLVNNAATLLAMGIFVTTMYFPIARSTNSINFYDGLPIKRNKKYAATVLVMLILESITIAISAITVGIGWVINKFTMRNQHILLLNLTTLGAVFFAQGVANAVALPLCACEKTHTITLLLPALAYMLSFLNMLLPASFVYVGDTPALVDYSAEWMWLRAIILAACILLFVLLTAVGYLIGKKVFDKRKI